MKEAQDNEGRSVEILGRGGIKYIDKRENYFIDSEMLFSAEFDLVIYSDSVRFYQDIYKSNSITQVEKKEILKMVVKLLRSAGIKAAIQL